MTTADLIPQVKEALSANGKMYAVPFYAESSFTFYRKDLFDKAGIQMPDKPTYAQIAEYAVKLTDKAHEQYGICLRGKPGWGENMAFFDTMVNAYGGQWFDMQWKPMLTSDAWKSATQWYLDVMAKAGPPGATANGHNENRALFATGKCAIWIDATSAAGYIYNPKDSQVADKTAFTASPITDKDPKASGWSWSWALAIPASSQKADAAKKFLAWSTSKEYVNLVGETARLGVGASGNAAVDLRQPQLHQGGAFRGDRAEGDPGHRHGPSDRESRALHRRAVRRDPGIPGDRDAGRPRDRCGPRRAADGRSGA